MGRRRFDLRARHKRVAVYKALLPLKAALEAQNATLLDLAKRLEGKSEIKAAVRKAFDHPAIQARLREVLAARRSDQQDPD